MTAVTGAPEATTLTMALLNDALLMSTSPLNSVWMPCGPPMEMPT
jgi:hypothetical protein